MSNALEVHGHWTPTPPKSALRPIFFPSLATMNQWTGDGRMLVGSGRGSRALPRTIYAEQAQSSGHMGSVPVGTLQEVTFHDDGNVSGKGWLVDVPEARKLAILMESGALRHNSIDLTEVDYDVEWTDDFEMKIRFTSWKIGATTIVGKPAFADARAQLDEELVASYSKSDEPLVFEPEDGAFEVRLQVDVPEIKASPVVFDHDDFFVPEPTQFQKIVVTADGLVYGHLGEWGSAHRNLGVPVPRPRDNYASFNAAGPLTTKGQVETGPIFFLHGHPDGPVGSKSGAEKAYGGVENKWADVRVVEGRIGPWFSGRVVPGVSDEAMHVARTSRVSGHWIGDELVAIVSCNVPAYAMPGTGLKAGGGARIENGKVLELVASFDPPEFIDEKYLSFVEAGSTSGKITFGTTSDALKNEETEISVSNVLLDAAIEMGPVDLSDEAIDKIADAVIGRLSTELPSRLRDGLAIFDARSEALETATTTGDDAADDFDEEAAEMLAAELFLEDLGDE